MFALETYEYTHTRPHTLIHMHTSISNHTQTHTLAHRHAQSPLTTAPRPHKTARKHTRSPSPALMPVPPPLPHPQKGGRRRGQEARRHSQRDRRLRHDDARHVHQHLHHAAGPRAPQEAHRHQGEPGQDVQGPLLRIPEVQG